MSTLYSTIWICKHLFNNYLLFQFLIFYFLFLFFNWRKLLYNVVLASGIQQYNSIVTTRVTSLPSFPPLPSFHPLGYHRLGSLCCAGAFYQLSILHMVVHI